MKKGAFTLAEVLATLSVIGIVAALLIPSVIINYKNHVFKTGKEAFRSNLINATRNMVAIDSKLNKAKSVEDEDDEEKNRTANEVFVQDYLAKYIKFAKICDPDSTKGIYDCGWSDEAVYAEVTSTNRFKIPTTNNKVGFEGNEKMWAAVGANGMAMLIAYNPNCKSLDSAASSNEDAATGVVSAPNYFNPKETACINILYDINGTASPNTFGKDVSFATVFYPKKAKVASPIFANNVEFKSANSFENADKYCNELSSKKDMMLPTLEEAASIYLNSKNMLNIETDKKVWFSSANEDKFSSFTASEAVCVVR